MTIFDRVKQRFETDLDDDELQRIIDEANQDVVNRYGPHASEGTPITERLFGLSEKLVVNRPIDTTKEVIIKEYVSEYGWGQTVYTLDPLDYRIWPGGMVIERLTTGPNSWRHWVEEVELIYFPINDGNQREEVIIKMVILALRYDGSFAGLASTRVGDVTTSQVDYVTERNKLLSSLAPHGGLGMA